MVTTAVKPEVINEPPIRKRKDWLPVIMTTPAVLALIGMMYPFAIAVYYSFTNFSLIKTTHKFVGFQNYARLFTNPDFWEAMGNTLFFATTALIFEFLFGFLITILLNNQVKGVRLMRTLLMLPLMLPPVIAAMMWRTMLASNTGPINYLFGLGDFAWLAHPWSARFVVMFIEIWSSTPFVALVLLSGLQSLPKEPFEAAQVDGANFFFVIRRLMLPMLQPFILVVLLFRVVDVIKLFDVIFTTTQGGPMYSTTTIPVLVFREVFKFFTLGSAIAKVLMLWIINYALSFWLAGRWRKSMGSM
ncbi:MAG: sugar ABC transporter permease [Pelolinea sp.]|nr:sugar ABC transporter permease [Pelolinea sp.]